LIKVGYGKLIICRGSRDELTLEAHTLQSVKRAIKSGMKTGRRNSGWLARKTTVRNLQRARYTIAWICTRPAFFRRRTRAGAMSSG